MPWQQSCHGMCKIVTWFGRFMIRANRIFIRIWLQDCNPLWTGFLSMLIVDNCRVRHNTGQSLSQRSPCGASSAYTGIILGMHPATERWHYNVTSSLIGWAHSQNDPCIYLNCFFRFPGSTVRCRYNPVHFLPNPHNTHPIAHTWGWDMGCLLLV